MYCKKGLNAKRKHGRLMFVVSERASSTLNLSSSSRLQVLSAPPEKLWPHYSIALAVYSSHKTQASPSIEHQESPWQMLWHKNVQDLGPKGVTSLLGHADMSCIS
jgi:hypothetical protein